MQQAQQAAKNVPLFKNRWYNMAKGTVQGARHIKTFFKGIHDTIIPPKLVIKRTGLVKRHYQEFDMYQYTIEQNAIPNGYYYFAALTCSMFFSFYVAQSLYDYDFRYYLFIRYPDFMKNYEEITQQISEKINQLQQQYIGDVPEIQSESDYYNFKEQVKDKLFDIQEKERQDKLTRENLRDEVKIYDGKTQNFDDFLNSQNKLIKKIKHED